MYLAPTTALFTVQNLKMILRSDPELWGCTIFRPKMVDLLQTRNLLEKLLILLSSTSWSLSWRTILKKLFPGKRLIKVQKPCFLCHFWSFLPAGDFFPKFQLCHTQLYLGPEKFPKKLMSRFRENLQTDGRTDGQKDGRTELFHRSLLETPGGPKNVSV